MLQVSPGDGGVASDRSKSDSQQSHDFERIKIMFLACHIQSVVERFLVGSPHKCDQGLDHQVHVIQLVGLQCSQAGWDFHIFAQRGECAASWK